MLMMCRVCVRHLGCRVAKNQPFFFKAFRGDRLETAIYNSVEKGLE